jgi:serine/threonine protein kinase
MLAYEGDSPMVQLETNPRWIGKVVGARYEIVEKLADGGRSQIFWGRNLLDDGPDAAIKVVRRNEKDPFVSDRLHREGIVLSLMQETPASPKLMDRHFTKEGDLVLVMELLDGMSLQSILDRDDRRLSLDEVIQLFTPVAQTLSALHARGIIHRDLHPGNLFRSWDPPGLKLWGYGEASFVNAPVVREGESVCGLPKYVAPEVWLGKTNLDQRVDVYSLAVILFRCLGGRCPFEMESSVELVHVAQSAPRPSLVQLCAEAPAALDDWATIALCPDREARFDNIDAMWKAFVRASRSTVQGKNLEPALTDSERLRAG